jgi:pilus assembly protein Flp/PilA
MHTDIVNYLQARFAKTERGAALVEYALLLALIAVVCIVAIGVIGNQANDKFSEIGSKLE